MAKKNDWMLYALGAVGLGAIIWYVTSQKAGAPQGGQGIAVGEPNPSAPKEGCGCGMEPESHSDSFASSAIPSTG